MWTGSGIGADDPDAPKAHKGSLAAGESSLQRYQAETSFGVSDPRQMKKRGAKPDLCSRNRRARLAQSVSQGRRNGSGRRGNPPRYRGSDANTSTLNASFRLSGAALGNTGGVVQLCRYWNRRFSRYSCRPLCGTGSPSFSASFASSLKLVSPRSIFAPMPSL